MGTTDTPRTDSSDGERTPGSLIDSLPHPASVWRAVRDEGGTIVDFVCTDANHRSDRAFAWLLGDRPTVEGLRYTAVFTDTLGRQNFPKFCEVVTTGKVALFETTGGYDPASWFEVLAARHGDGFVNIIRDITQRRAVTDALEESERRLRIAEQQAKESKRRFQLMADHAGDVVVAVRHGLVEWAAPSLERLMGWTVDDVTGQESIGYVHPDDRHIVDEIIWSSRHAVRTRVRIRRKDGRYQWADMIGRVAGPDDEPTHPLVLTFIDAQAEMEARDALQRAEEERQRLDERMRESARLDSLAELAGGIAHDFNNLLVGVLGNAELALQDLPQTSPVRGRLVALSAAAQRAAELTRQLLDFTGRQPRERIALDLAPVIVDTVDLAQSMISREVTVTVALEPSTRGVLGDRSQLQQVVMNLVMNASEAVDQHSGQVQVTTRSTTIEEDAPDIGLTAGEYVVLEVADNGRGIEPEQLWRIFDPFFTTRADGRGLGLAVVSGIVRAHHGAVQVRSEPDEGTTFTVWLPAVDAPDALPVSAPGFRLHRQPTVMVVDDDDQVRDVTGDVLRRAGFQVLPVGRGREAISLFASRHATIDCVVLDLTMPDLAGDEVLVVLRAVEPSIPVVLMSGYLTNDPIRGAANLTANEFVQKPFLPDTLIESVRRSLRQTPFEGGRDRPFDDGIEPT